MNIAPKLRMIAGPNASGKTTLTKLLLTLNFNFGDYINADELEEHLTNTRQLNFHRFSIVIFQENFLSFFREHPLCPADFSNKTEIRDNILYVNEQNITGYFGAILADFIRQQLLLVGHSFTFETVMSSPDKIELLKAAREKGYRTYLYYICTDDVIINKDRAANREKLGGHSVPENKIEPRYDRSLDLLLHAIKQSDRAYLFDNSGTEHVLIAEVTGGKQIELKTKEMPVKAPLKTVAM